MTSAPKTRPRGRPRSEAAESHQAVMDAVYAFLKEHSVRELTMEGIAERANVGKPTIYKWWPNKSLVALDAYLAGMTEQVPTPDSGSAEVDFARQLKSLMAFYTSPLGRLFGQFIAEGQSDPSFLALFRERFLYARRAAARVMWQRGVDRGEIRNEIDGEIVLDMIYGPMIFRLLAGHGSLGPRESDALVEAVFAGVRRSKDRHVAKLKRNGSVVNGP